MGPSGLTFLAESRRGDRDRPTGQLSGCPVESVEESPGSPMARPAG
jgi:hypothetical protein